MSQLLCRLQKQKKISPPDWLPGNTIGTCIIGSEAYGTCTDTSDKDIYGVCIPPKRYVFPWTSGYLPGFSQNIPKFEQWQQHHIEDSDSKQNYDFSVYGIVRYFRLCADNNPNIIDSLFTPRKYVTHSTPVYEIIRENRHLFIHKGLWHKFKGYSFSQLSKAKSQKREGKRKEITAKLGYDPKFLNHVVRLLSEAEELLLTGNLTLDEKGRREHCKAIKRGEVKLEDIERWAADKEFQLEKLYHSSKLPYSPPEDKIQALLLNCLEHWYGDLSVEIQINDKYEIAIRKIQEMVNNL